MRIPLKVGEHVSCNGYPGVIAKICIGQLDGMVEVRLDHGRVCVDASEILQPVYRNLAFKKRDYESTNIAACSTIDPDAKIPTNYEQCPVEVIKDMTPLWVEEGIQYWGWL